MQVPPVFLKQLTGDRQIFRDLPAKVQRQVSPTLYATIVICAMPFAIEHWIWLNEMNSAERLGFLVNICVLHIQLAGEFI